MLSPQQLVYFSFNHLILLYNEMSSFLVNKLDIREHIESVLHDLQGSSDEFLSFPCEDISL